MKIGFTGTQRGMSKLQKEALFFILSSAPWYTKYFEFHYGDCIGADAEAFEMATESNMITISHPPNIDTKRAFTKPDEERPPKDYLDRNQDIVDESDILIAAPKTLSEEQRSGTWATVRRARGKGIPVIILEP